MCVCVLQQSPQTPLTEQFQEGLLIGEAAGSDGGQQSLLSEISEADMEALRQKEEALLQIEVSKLTAANCIYIYLICCWFFFHLLDLDIESFSNYIPTTITTTTTTSSKCQ